jgi:hypothetical protein
MEMMVQINLGESKMEIYMADEIDRNSVCVISNSMRNVKLD